LTFNVAAATITIIAELFKKYKPRITGCCGKVDQCFFLKSTVLYLIKVPMVLVKKRSFKTSKLGELLFFKVLYLLKVYRRQLQHFVSKSQLKMISQFCLGI